MLTLEKRKLYKRNYGHRILNEIFETEKEVAERYKISQNPTDKETAQTLLNSIYSLIDKGSKKNIYHKNTAARKKSQLAAQLKAA